MPTRSRVVWFDNDRMGIPATAAEDAEQLRDTAQDCHLAEEPGRLEQSHEGRRLSRVEGVTFSAFFAPLLLCFSIITKKNQLGGKKPSCFVLVLSSFIPSNQDLGNPIASCPLETILVLH